MGGGERVQARHRILDRDKTWPNPIFTATRKKDLVPVLRIYGPSVLYSTFLSHISLLIKFLCTTPFQRTSNLTIGTRIDPAKFSSMHSIRRAAKVGTLFHTFITGIFWLVMGNLLFLSYWKPQSHILFPHRRFWKLLSCCLSHVGLLSLFQFPVFHLD